MSRARKGGALAEKRELLDLLQVKAYCVFTCLRQENILRLEHEKKELADKRRKIRIGQKVPKKRNNNSSKKKKRRELAEPGNEFTMITIIIIQAIIKTTIACRKGRRL